MHNFERQVLQFVKQEQLIVPQDRLVIACSGGVDSMALVSFCLKLTDVEIIVAHVDHMLRKEQSYEDLKHVERFCQQHGLKFVSARIDIPKLLEAQGGNLQTLCRTERYNFFARVMQQQQATKLLTAHHADDQLESMLMALLKSSTPASLQGIKVKNNFRQWQVVRPFLTMTKEEIKSYAADEKISYREDASNAKDDYLRNRIRHHTLPLLYAENAQVSKQAVHLSMQLAEDEVYLQQQAMAAFSNIVNKKDERTYYFKIESFVRIPVALQRRLVLILLNYVYNDVSAFQNYAMTSAILNLIQSQEGSATLHLPQQVVAHREYDQLKIGPMPRKRVLKEAELKLNEWNEYNEFRIYIGESSYIPPHHTNQSIYYFNKATVTFPLHIRTRQQGDKIHCLGMTQSKKLSRIFIDEKIPFTARDEWPVLVDHQDEILALIGIRVSTIFSRQKRANDDYILIIESL